MNRVETLHRLELDNQPTLDEKIDPLMTQKLATVSDREDFLAFEGNPVLAKLNSTRRRVDTLAHSRSELAVNFQERTDGPGDQQVNIRWKQRLNAKSCHCFVSSVFFVIP